MFGWGTDVICIAKDDRPKLNDKCQPLIFLLFGDEEFAYRLYDDKAKLVIKIGDVVFLQGQTLLISQSLDFSLTVHRFSPFNGNLGP